MHVLVELLWTLLKVAWISLRATWELFNPFKSKKNVERDIVLITGAGSGIGRLMAIRFAKLGAKLILWDINREANEAVAKEIKELGKVAHPFVCDCSKREEIYRVADQVKREIGEVTILVNNAGIISGKKFFESDDKLVDLTFKINTVAHFWIVKAFAPAMMAKNKGHIITIASSAGFFGAAGLTDYCGSKFGAVGLHESLAAELFTLGLDGIKTTLVCPYYINTGMFDGVTTRFPALLPILKPDFAVDKIMDAFHSDQYLLMTPKFMYLFLLLLPVLPKRALLELGTFLGVHRGMDTFISRQKQD